MKLLKNISGQLVQLYLGTNTVSLAPNETVEYYSVVVENPSLPDFNLSLVESYLTQNILTVVSEMPKAQILQQVLPEVVVNFSPAIPTTINANTQITFENLTSADLDTAIVTWTVMNSSGPTTIAFMDSTTSSSINPVVKFISPGLYNIGLNVLEPSTGKAGSLVKTGLISVI